MLGLSALLLAVLREVHAEEQAPISTSDQICDPSTFSVPAINSVTVLSVFATPQTNYSTPPLDILPPITNLNFCEVNIHLTHDSANDDVLIRVWLPLSRGAWNGRFQATGGGGFATSMGFVGLAPALQQGYAAVSTDGGHDEFSWTSLDWLLNPDRTIKWELWENFMHRSVVEQIVVGKDIVGQYYAEKPHHSYWNGCSQGGRQGYMLAQKYPELLDGIMAAAPALDLGAISMGGFWPQLVMNDAKTYVSSCEFAYFTDKVMAACDMLDGYNDGVVMNPEDCEFEPERLVGEEIACDGQKTIITASMATVVRKIREGPRSPSGAKIWYGLTPGTNYATLANITIGPDGTRSAYPIALPVLDTLLLPPGVNLTSLTPTDYFALWAQASVEWGWALFTESTDLTALRDSGAKLLSWHGITDDIIPHEGTIEYLKRVQRQMGGARKVDEFYRLFLAPGVGHCALGEGPMPADPLAALIDWVENGAAPRTLDAQTANDAGETVTRWLCKWPARPVYAGVGDPREKSSWDCVDNTGVSNVVYAGFAHSFGQ